MLKYFKDIANTVTLSGLCFGLLSIIYSIEMNWNLSISFMLLAVICDVFDGIIARKFRPMHRDISYQKIGFQLDTLADLIHSGVAPGIFIYMYTGQNWLSIVIMFFIVSGSYLRLAYFNTNKMTEDQCFYGLPVFYSPMILCMFLFVSLMLDSNIYLYIFAVLIPVLQTQEKLRIKKLSEGFSFYLFLFILFGELLIAIAFNL